ncbi:6035_t:CDS:2, partial [Funneliformis geosporum]
QSILQKSINVIDKDQFDKSLMKRKRQEDARKSSRDTKAQIIIRELSVFPASRSSISEPSEGSNMGEVLNQFHKLYYDIDIAKKDGDKSWEDCSWGYHGDNGNTYLNNDVKSYGPKFMTGDTIGC